MNDTWVTLQGWAGSDVERKEAGGVPLATFRIGSTPRHQKDGEWVDGTTAWFTVNAWRALARNVADSVHRGDPLVVHGRLRADVWEREGQPASVRWVVEAATVGHDLSRGVSGFQRAVRRDRAAQGEPVAPDGGSGGAGAVPEQRSSPEAAA
ncbi:hypothetical protein LUZ63_020760 [Rhynchospora breviuscula]|uniref:Single-stranded DNA-binding protein n=1 Tax=Rhynchospora breviuscula TaxID=2022672 RepID=A0A9Q0BZF3_9POAL|nr:hypothetical protein LUZ63_020760 [Rhynchospora breviuscula]